MLKDETLTTFSDLWYRVASTTPALSPHANITRQHFGPRVAFIIEDPAGSQYYRMSESAYLFVGLLDGTRTIDEAWNTCNAKLGDEAPTQRECIEVLSKLQLYGLLRGETALAADMVEHRGKQLEELRLKRRTGQWLFYSIPLFNPDPLLERFKGLLAIIFSRWMFMAWALLVFTALIMVARNWRDLGSQFNQILDPTYLPILGITFLALRIIHELGHAAACKALGGRSTEIGVILILLILPLPYCDATSAWRFPQIWKRVLVSAAGILAESFIAAIAAITWALTEEGTVLHALCYTIMLISGVATLLFNLNPLLRYDGYYILSDVTGTPNLAQRSREIWSYIFERRLFGVRSAKPPAVRSRGELTLLTTYGALSAPYRILIFVSILAIVLTTYAQLGLVLALIAGVAWVVRPVAKLISYLLASPRLIGRRARAIGIVTTAVAAVVLLFGVIPMPAGGYAPATVEPLAFHPVRAGETGFVVDVLAREGQRVAKGDPIIVLRDTAIDAELRIAEARLKQAHIERDDAATNDPEREAIANLLVQQRTVELHRAQERAAALTIRSPGDGVLALLGGAHSLRNMHGRHITKGDLIAAVLSNEDLIIRALVPEKQHALLLSRRADEAPAHYRLWGTAGSLHDATIVRTGAIATHDLSSRALSTAAGGPIVIDPNDPEGRRALEPHVTIDLEPAQPEPTLRAGQRARVRFSLKPEPLLTQSWRRVRQWFRGNLS